MCVYYFHVCLLIICKLFYTVIFYLNLSCISLIKGKHTLPPFSPINYWSENISQKRKNNLSQIQSRNFLHCSFIFIIFLLFPFTAVPLLLMIQKEYFIYLFAFFLNLKNKIKLSSVLFIYLSNFKRIMALSKYLWYNSGRCISDWVVFQIGNRNQLSFSNYQCYVHFFFQFG